MPLTPNSISRWMPAQSRKMQNARPITPQSKTALTSLGQAECGAIHHTGGTLASGSKRLTTLLRGGDLSLCYSFFNTNEKIVRSSFSENEWISYYEAQVEPDLLQIAAEHTRKLWNRRQRAFGNKLYLESSNLQYASMSTKLSLESMVDRGAMLPNEWRAVFGLAPVAGGDEPIRRLDTAPVKQTKSGGETE